MIIWTSGEDAARGVHIPCCDAWFKSHLCFQSSFLLTQWWLKYLSPCHPYGTQVLSSRLPALAYTGSKVLLAFEGRIGRWKIPVFSVTHCPFPCPRCGVLPHPLHGVHSSLAGSPVTLSSCSVPCLHISSPYLPLVLPQPLGHFQGSLEVIALNTKDPSPPIRVHVGFFHTLPYLIQTHSVLVPMFRRKWDYWNLCLFF